jgi:tetratricopeptide (TPR) repeat protein
MNGNARKHIRRLVGSAVAILLICGANAFALQEKVSPLSDFQYKKDFAQYDAIKKEADAQKRADMLLGFIKERPISRMLLYATNDYLECVKPVLAKNDFPKTISMIEAFLAVLPTEKTVQDAQIPVGADEFIKTQLVPTQASLQQALLQVYYQSNNMPKAAEAAEKLYALAPNKAMLPVLADIYFKMQNWDKYLEIGQKMLAEFPMDQPQGFETAITMSRVYIQKQDIITATDLLTKVMDVYGDKVPPNVQEAQWNATRAFAYGVIASGIYSKKDYPKALELYDKVAKFDPKRDDAYYYIGMSKWQTKDPEGAIEAFAKCVVLNKATATKAKQYLEDLFKARHNNTLDGLDQVMAKAKSDLGM